jgi:hypothetical protein
VIESCSERLLLLFAIELRCLRCSGQAITYDRREKRVWLVWFLLVFGCGVRLSEVPEPRECEDGGGVR